MRQLTKDPAGMHAPDMSEHRLVCEFFSADRQQRAYQLRLELGRIRDDCRVRVLLNPEDAEGQPMPSEAQTELRTWAADPAVPVGEYHLVISMP